jgi:RNA polymerase sigma-70 factor (ECF subfamily)
VRESSLEDEPETVYVNREPSALTVLESKDTARVVREILNRLTERDRHLLESVLLDERDKDVVCVEFGVSREYLRVLVHRAKQSFKSLYVQHLGEQGPL